MSSPYILSHIRLRLLKQNFFLLNSNFSALDFSALDIALAQVKCFSMLDSREKQIRPVQRLDERLILAQKNYLNKVGGDGKVVAIR